MKVGYIYDDTIGLHTYGPGHPMNPFRIEMTHSLVKSLGFEKKMDVYEPTRVPLTYHPKTYLHSLSEIETNDCPKIENIEDFCDRYASASINAAMLINQQRHDIVINWGGGLHHAHKEEASGFCYVNDIVMCANELLKKHNRVMYVDIDVHHGDGIEEAFYENDRVLTLSLHKHGKGFFPETGGIITTDRRAVNVPLLSGINDDSYKYIYEPIVSNAIRKFKPDVLIAQCGADSLGEDRLGPFNLSVSGHSRSLQFLKNLGLPMVVLGGGGYTIKNVARCWAYETGMLCGAEIPEIIPKSDPYYEYYADSYKLDPEFKTKHKNRNNTQYLDAIMSYVQEKIDQF